MRVNMRSMMCAVAVLMIFVLGCTSRTEIEREEREIESMKQEVKQLEEDVRNARIGAQAENELLKLMKEVNMVFEKTDVVFAECVRIVEHKNDSVAWEEVKKMLVLIEEYNVESENIILKMEKMVGDKKSGLDGRAKRMAIQRIKNSKQFIAMVRNSIELLGEAH